MIVVRIPEERIPKELIPDALEQILLDINRAVVAFSGGADSALLAHAANAVRVRNGSTWSPPCRLRWPPLSGPTPRR